MAKSRAKHKSRQAYGHSGDPYSGYQVNDASLTKAAKARVVKKDRQGLEQHVITTYKEMPHNMRKYWYARHSLFSMFDGSSSSGLLPKLDLESWYSVTPESIAARIAERSRCEVVLDAFCGAGGNAIQFAYTCERVIAIDIDPIKIRLAKWNAKVYGVEGRITFLTGDFYDFVADYNSFRTHNNGTAKDKWNGAEKLPIEVVFLSPPWGGITYHDPSSLTPRAAVPIKSLVKQKAHETNGEDDLQSSPIQSKGPAYYPLSLLAPRGGQAMFEAARSITENVAIYLPRTIDLNQLLDLAKRKENQRNQRNQRDSTSRGIEEEEVEGEEVKIDVEEQFLGSFCKALTCYFGDLAKWDGSW